MKSSDSQGFVRRYDTPLADLAGRVAGESVRRVGPDAVEASVVLPVGRLRRVPMRLLLFGGPGTIAELVPERRVRSGRAYFRAGHRFLDALRQDG